MFNNILKNISPVVKNILIINILFFVAQLTFPIFMGGLSLYPFVSEGFEPWQLATHFFMHDPKSIGHIFFNMFAVVIFGTQLERVWGPKKFLGYYLICALGAALLYMLVNYLRLKSFESHLLEISLIEPTEIQYYLDIAKNQGLELIKSDKNFTDFPLGELNSLVNAPMLGASGAVFGLLAAFGYLFPNTELMLLFPPIPIKAKYFVIGYAALELYLGISNNPSDNVAHFAHLGGALVGIIIVLYWGKNRNSFF
jgi:membrane associated rhomboid family serine protease